MRLRILAVAAALATVVSLAAPAHADIGTHCSGWRWTSIGTVQSACYDRTVDYRARGRGRAYYDGPYSVDQMNIGVSLQRSEDGTSWTTIKSASCGWTGDNIATDTPGNVCLTGAVDVDASSLYRSRVFTLLFFSNGVIWQSGFTYSPMTT